MVKIKICGITNKEDAEKAVSLGADYIGFIFADSPRKIEPHIAKPIIENLKGKVLSTGVFVNESPEAIRKTIECCSLDAIQLHGDESPQYCSQLDNTRVIKTFRIKDSSSLNPISRYKNVFAYLLDTFSDRKYGGTGRAFDWELAIRAKSFGKPIILSGGLGLNNIEEAIKSIKPYAVDISSSIELKPGKKDHKAMERLFAVIKALDE